MGKILNTVAGVGITFFAFVLSSVLTYPLFKPEIALTTGAPELSRELDVTTATQR